jgi:hypothetical protein
MGTWGQQLVSYRQLAAAFADTLRQSSAFYAMLNDAVRLPFETYCGSISVGAAASAHHPGMAIPVTSLSLGTNNVLGRNAAAGIVVLTEELLQQGTSVESIITRSLQASVGDAIDSAFLTQVLAGAPMGAAGSDPLGAARALLNAVAPGTASRLWWVAGPNVARRLATAGRWHEGAAPPPMQARLRSRRSARSASRPGWGCPSWSRGA